MHIETNTFCCSENIILEFCFSERKIFMLCVHFLKRLGHEIKKYYLFIHRQFKLSYFLGVVTVICESSKMGLHFFPLSAASADNLQVGDWERQQIQPSA